MLRIGEKVGGASIEEKLVEFCLGWFEHVRRGLIEVPIESVH